MVQLVAVFATTRILSSTEKVEFCQRWSGPPLRSNSSTALPDDNLCINCVAIKKILQQCFADFHYFGISLFQTCNFCYGISFEIFCNLRWKLSRIIILINMFLRKKFGMVEKALISFPLIMKLQKFSSVRFYFLFLS